MTRHLPYCARIWRLGREHIFGVCVVTFDTWHLAIVFDWVQGIMLASQGKVVACEAQKVPFRIFWEENI